MLWRLCTHQEVGEELVYASQGLWHSQSGLSLTRGGCSDGGAGEEDGEWCGFSGSRTRRGSLPALHSATVWCPGLQIQQQQWRKPRPRGQEVRQDLGDPGKTLLTSVLVNPGNQGGTAGGGGGGGRPLPGKHCPLGDPWAGALGRAGSGAGREDPGSGLRRVTVTQPLGRPTPCNAVDSIHARRSRASTWTHSGSGGAWRLRWSLGCLTLQDPARPPRWLGLPSPQSSNAGAPSGAPGHLHAFCPSPQTSGVSRL